MAKADLAADIRGFFGQYLVAQRGVSNHTVLGYRDAMKLFLQFAAHHHRKAIIDLTLEDQRLSRFGVRYIVAHRVDFAAKACPTLLGKKVTPHTFRHTTAMHLLQSNVDLNMIRSWLGHASIETTNTYVEIDLEMKRKTLDSCAKLILKSGRRTTSWQRDSDVLSWLSQL